jgi:DNA-binding HxlR family transcriptional regulator
MSPWLATADGERHAVTHEVLARLGDRWSVLVIQMIADEPIRFTDLRRKISASSPISARVLTRTLKQLEQDGLIARKAFPVVPPRVEYSLTELGRRFHGLADRIVEWTLAYCPDLETARQAPLPQNHSLSSPISP